jgi:hypothetical protein
MAVREASMKSTNAMTIKTRSACRGAGLPLLALTGALSCGEDFSVVPVRNLERPSDLGFACLALVDTPSGPVVSGRPMSFCHSPDKLDPRVDLNNRAQGTFGLATNTSRGELAAIDFDLAEYRVSPLLDLDPRNPGYNQLPVGALPEVISVSDDGCRAVTANRGSCDLSLVDLSRLMAPQFPVRTPSTGAGSVVSHVRFMAGMTEMRAAPHEVSILPTGQWVDRQEQAREQPAPACRAEGIARPDGPVPWQALVTFPGCDLVALVNLPSGAIVSSLRIQPDGTAIDAGQNPACPAECPDVAGGMPPAPGIAGTLGVGALAVMPEGNRAYVAAARSPFVTPIDVSPTALVANAPLELAEGPGGITRLRLSANIYGPNLPFGGRFLGERGMFMYGFARDGSVRVIDLNRTPMGRERECDVNVDPNTLFSNLDSVCHPVAENRPRRLLATGPGLRIPVSEEPDVAPPVPVDIAFAQVGLIPTGFLLASNGQIYHLALNGAVGSQAVSRDLPTLPHNFRRVGVTPGSVAGGFPFVIAEPERQFTTNRTPFPTRVGFNSRLDGPRVEGYGDNKYVEFPRAYGAVPEDFDISWEGVLPGTDRGNAHLDPADPAGLTLTDPGADFCRSGVEEGDILALLGCEQDFDCDRERRGLAVCHRASPGAQGVCLPRDFAADEERLRVCRPEFSSRRRYQVKEVFRSRLTLAVRLDEVPQPRLYACQEDSVCQPGPSHQPGTTPGDPGFRCLAPGGGADRRCLKTCGERAPDGSFILNDRLCRAGHVCADVGDAALGPLCIEAPLPRPECLPLSLAYRVQAGQAYLTRSSAVPFLASRREEPSPDRWGGRCLPDPTRNPLYGQRIPMTAPHCTNVVDGPGATAEVVVKAPPEAMGGWGNPCLFRGPNGDAGGGQEHVKALFENPNVRLVFTNLEQYVGDAAAVRVSIQGGFSPLRVRPTRPSVDFRLGARILTGPMDSSLSISDTIDGAPPPYLFVVDQGRTSTSLSRGQILRINPRPSQVFPGGFIDSPDSNSLFPIQ